MGSLPPGLTISSPSTGPSITISGTPTSQGTFNFTVRVTDTLGQFATRALSITINLPAPPNITITTLPAGTINQTYNQACAGNRDGNADLQHRLPRYRHTPPGSRPESASTGTITGTPTATGTLPVHRPRRRHFRTELIRKRFLFSLGTYNPPQITFPPRCQVEQSVCPTVRRRYRQPEGWAHLPGVFLWDRSHQVSPVSPQLDPV